MSQMPRLAFHERICYQCGVACGPSSKPSRSLFHRIAAFRDSHEQRRFSMLNIFRLSANMKQLHISFGKDTQSGCELSRTPESHDLWA